MTLRHKSNAMEMVSVNNKSPKQAFDARLVGNHKDSRGVYVAQETYFAYKLQKASPRSERERLFYMKMFLL